MRERSRAFAAALRAKGIHVRFHWERTEAELEEEWRSYASRVRSMGCIDFIDESHPLQEERRQRAFVLNKWLDGGLLRKGRWLDRIPEDPVWFDYVLKISRYAAKGGTLRRSRSLGLWAITIDGMRFPKLYERYRELEWHDVNQAAQRDGRMLPKLLEGERFSLHGYNLRVSGYGPSCLRVHLLDEEGKFAASADLFHEVDAEAPVEVSRPLPRGARSTMYLLLNLLGDLAAHLDGKPDR